MREELKFTIKVLGGPYVMITGNLMMQLLSASSWDFLTLPLHRMEHVMGKEQEISSWTTYTVQEGKKKYSIVHTMVIKTTTVRMGRTPVLFAYHKMIINRFSETYLISKNKFL